MLGRKYAKAKKTLKSIAKYIAVICILLVIIWFSIEPITKWFIKHYIDIFKPLLDWFDDNILQIKRDKNGNIISEDLKRRSYVYSITYALIVVVTMDLRYLNKDTMAMIMMTMIMKQG